VDHLPPPGKGVNRFFREKLSPPSIAIMNDAFGAEETAKIFEMLGKCWSPSTEYDV
jgi:hypothetical protein